MKTPYAYYDNVMAISADALYKADEYGNDAALLSYYSYESRKRANKFKVLKNGCRGNSPILEWDTMDFDLQQALMFVYGDPYKVVERNRLAEALTNDSEAYKFYSEFVKVDGSMLSERQIKQYTDEASILNAVKHLMVTRINRMNVIGAKKSAAWTKLAQKVADLSNDQYAHRLPTNARSLERKYKKYVKEGYESLIHGQNGKKTAEKINDEAKVWLIARWGDRVNKVANIAQMFAEYNDRAKELAWKPLKNEKTIRDYLYKPDVQYLWYGHRYGELKFKEKFVFHSSTKMASMRDSLWYSDGTKLNYFYLDDDGNVATCQVYEVIDAFSDTLLGFHISKTEDFEAQFYGYKMAVNFAGHKPYELKYDNQGGHKKLENSNFLTKIAHLALKTKPYNGKSKTIESLFNRFQSQILKKDWFFTGQNITAKKEESKINREYVLANKKNLPTLDQVKSIYEQRRNEWNNAEHHATGIPRIEMYNNSTNPGTPEFGILEYIEVFWLLREKAITCNASGISFVHKGSTYKYVTYKNNGKTGYERDIDVLWLAQNIDQKFRVRFDPTDFSIIRLYKENAQGELSFVCEAESLIIPHRNKQEQEDWEAKHYAAVDKAKDELRLAVRDTMDAMQSDHGIAAQDYGMISPPIKGLETGKRHKNKIKKAADKAKVEQDERKKVWNADKDTNKLESNYVAVTSEDEADFDPITALANKINN